MRVEITYDGGLSLAARAVEEKIGEIIAAGAETVCKSAKELCPVDTGRLRDSISVSPSVDGAIVSSDADYAAYVEFGTSSLAPQPYLVPALLMNTSSIIASAAEAIVKEVERGG